MKRQNRWIQCADPDEAWKEGWGWLLRLYTIFGVTAIDVAATTLTLYLEFGWAVACGVFLFGMVIVTALYITRKINKYVLGASGALHRLHHAIRDDVARLLEAASRPEQEQEYHVRYERFHDDIADRIAEVFRQLTGDATINCAIRLAERRNSQDEYVTAGRSKNMDPSRREASKPIPSDKGIAHFLRDKDRRGVFIIDNIQQAIDVGAWFPTPTDKLHDVKTLIVAPVNGYGIDVANGHHEKTMLGILYVTSRGHRFSHFHCELLMALADVLGFTYPVVTGKLR